MGLLKLLAAPVTFPGATLHWLLETLQREAEAEYYDVENIRRQISEIEQAVERGEIDEAHGDELTGRLVERMMEAGRYHSAHGRQTGRRR